jgi:uncharacterized protein (DUF1800 family)
MKRENTIAADHRLDVTGTAILAAMMGAFLAIPLAKAAPNDSAGNSSRAAHAGRSQAITLDKKFKGELPITELTEDEAILHALNRLAYGPRPGDRENIRKIGLAKWIDQQLAPDSIDDSWFDGHIQSYPTLRMSSQQLLDEFPPPNQAAKKEGITKEEYKEQVREKQQQRMGLEKAAGDDNLDKAQQQLAKIQGPNRIIAELSMAKLDRAIYSQRQLEAVMEDFWFNHFNVFAGKDAERWLITSYVRDVIRPHTMGKFQDLLLATAKSPAMLIYLDNWLSADPAAFQHMQQEIVAHRQRYQGIFGPSPLPPPNMPGATERAPARRQQHGLNENYGREIMELHTVGVDGGYTQQDVIEMAKCLTGWTVRAPRKNPEFFFDDRIHASGKKVVMGRAFQYGGMKDGEEALKMLANHSSTAKFISTELARHFVSDDPPEKLIDRMVRSYETTHGVIRSVLRTMIYSPEFWSKSAYRAKVKTPLELVASTARALGASVQLPLPLVQWAGRLGEPLFECVPPTGYSDKAEKWINAGALLNRLNFALAFAADRMPGAQVDLETMFGDDAASDPHRALERSLDVFIGGQASPATRQTLESRLSDPQILEARLDDPVKHVNEGLISGLVLGAPEFQHR